MVSVQSFLFNFSNSFADDDSFTISMWFKSTSSSFANTLIFYYTACENPSEGDDDFFAIILYNGQGLRLINAHGTTSNLVDGKWHHLVVTQQANRSQIHIDRNLASETNGVIALNPIPNNYDLVIGHLHSSSCADNHFFRVRKRILEFTIEFFRRRD